MEDKKQESIDLPVPHDIPKEEKKTESYEDDSRGVEDTYAHDSESFEWESLEYIHRTKGVLWFVALCIVSLVALGLAIYFKVWTLSFLIVIVGIAVGVYARRKPKLIHFSLGPDGITIDEVSYGFEEFRSFGVVRDETLYSAVLIPIKRFMPAINLFFDETQGEKIMDILGSYLPEMRVHEDLFTRILKRVRF